MTRKPASQHSGGQLRIIAGEWRSRKLPVADLPGLRPTPDRVRETVFNWLAPYVPGAKVLDCFSGTGALSLEALSRGASEAVMLEMATPAANTLKSNLVTLNAKNGQVINTDSMKWLKQPAQTPYDVIFLDPPFRKDLLKETCQLLEDNGYLDDNTLIYIEVEKELLPLPVPESWSNLRQKNAGQICFSLWRSMHKELWSKRISNYAHPVTLHQCSPKHGGHMISRDT